MSFLNSWLDLIVKLCLLSLYTMGLWACRQKITDKIIPFPLILTASLPFFIAYKIEIALGKGAALNWLYTLVAFLSCIIVWTFAVLNKSSQKTSIHYLALAKQHRIFVCLAIGIFIFFCWKGLYLEYPGDAIIYWQRIGQANQDGAASWSSLWQYSSSDTFFSSFQNWLVGTDSLMRVKLRPITALTSCILCFATYRAALWCTQQKGISVLAVVLFLGFYGNLQISFFSYKILQGASLAMIIYLEMIPFFYHALADTKLRNVFKTRKQLYFLFILLSVWLCIDCHKEKVFYLFVVAFSYALLGSAKYLSNRKYPPVILSSVLFLTSGFLFFLFLSDKPIFGAYSLPLITTWFSLENQTLFTYWPAEANSSVILLDFLSIGLAIALLTNYQAKTKEFFMAAIAIAPFLLFINPIAITGLIKITNPNNLYRIMLAGLPWIFLPFACQTLQRDKSIRLGYLPFLFILFGFLAYAPIYGKFSHLLNRVPTYADGRDLTPVIEYLLNKTELEKTESLKILAPPYVNAYLGSWPNFEVASNRWIFNDIDTLGPDLGYLYSSEITTNEIIEFINTSELDVIIIDHRDGLTYQSWLGRMTQHWAPDLIASQQALMAGLSLRDFVKNQPEPLLKKILEANGFQVYQVIDP